MGSLFQLLLATALGTKIADSTGHYHPNLVSTTLKMVAALGLVLGSLLIAAYIAKRFLQKEGGSTKEILVRVLGNTAIGMKKSIALVEVPGAVLVLGVSNDTICLLSKIEDEETLHRIRRPNGGKISTPFAAQLHEFSLRFKKEKNGK